MNSPTQKNRLQEPTSDNRSRAVVNIQRMVDAAVRARKCQNSCASRCSFNNPPTGGMKSLDAVDMGI
jgi:hypothetical protein